MTFSLSSSSSYPSLLALSSPTTSASASANTNTRNHHQNHHQQNHENNQNQNHNQVVIQNYLQKLNNRATICIEIGQYSNALTFLAKALQLISSETQTTNDDDQTSPACCQCYHCSIDGCILPSDNDDDDDDTNNNKDDFDSDYDSDSDGYNDDDEDDEDGVKKTKNKHDSDTINIDGYYIYQRPILIPSRTICSNDNHHRMDILTLFLIISFNLGLAHHLINIETTSNEIKNSGGNSNVKFDNTLQFYILARDMMYRRRQQQQQQVADAGDASININTQSYQNQNYSMRFDMILCNNICHIYYYNKQQQLQQQCLRDLNSIIVLAIDHNKTINDSMVMQQQQLQMHYNGTTGTGGGAFCSNSIKSIRRSSIPCITTNEMDVDVEFEYCDNEYGNNDGMETDPQQHDNAVDDDDDEYGYYDSMDEDDTSTIDNDNDKEDDQNNGLLPLIDINEGFLKNINICDGHKLSYHVLTYPFY